MTDHDKYNYEQALRKLRDENQKLRQIIKHANEELTGVLTKLEEVKK